MYWRIFLAGGVCASVSHGWAVPLDVVKTRMQTDPCKYSGGVAAAFRTIMAEEGPNMLLKGLGATLMGYGVQGSLKYGLYALFKNVIAGALPHASIFVNWVLASIGADVLASTALCPMEATRIRLVADPSFAKGTMDGLQRLLATEGPGGIFRGMPAILAKQLPYTIVQVRADKRGGREREEGGTREAREGLVCLLTLNPYPCLCLPLCVCASLCVCVVVWLRALDAPVLLVGGHCVAARGGGPSAVASLLRLSHDHGNDNYNCI
jgi:hypothetical protein